MCGTSAHGRRICAQHPHETAALTRHACPTHPVRCHLPQERVSSPTRAFGRASTSALPARMPRGPRSEDAVVRPLPEIDTIRRSERMEPLDNRRLRRALDEGTWVKVAPGAFVRSDHWLMLTPIERHRVRVHEVARRLEPGAVISYAAAAAEHGIDMLDPWPEAVDVTCGPATGGRSSGVVRRHTRDRRTLEVMPFGRHMITTPAQTALDLARSLRFLPAVASDLGGSAGWRTHRHRHHSRAVDSRCAPPRTGPSSTGAVVRGTRSGERSRISLPGRARAPGVPSTPAARAAHVADRKTRVRGLLLSRG